MRKLIPLVALAVTLVLPACDSFAQALGAHKNVVARAAGHDLTVDQTVSLLQQNPRLPNQPHRTPVGCPTFRQPPSPPIELAGRRAKREG